MVQSSNIYGPDGESTANRQGTFAYLNSPQSLNWSNYAVNLTIRSTDNDGIGGLFYYKDSANYYKFEMDHQRNFYKIIKVTNGIESELATASGPYPLNIDMMLSIQVLNNQILILLDGKDLFNGPTTDTAHASGTIGLYSWGNQNSFFDNIDVSTGSSSHALAGESINVRDNDFNGVETVSFDGTKSFAVNSTITSYTWSQNSLTLATGVNPTIDMPIGVHDITLTVANSAGDVSSDQLRVTINSANSFKIAVLPDTGDYTSTYPYIFAAQTQWIADNMDSENIRFMLHEGDLTSSNTAEDWSTAYQNISILDGKIPYLLVTGNHDMGINGQAESRNTDLFNLHFPVNRYSSEPWFGGVYETEKLDNYFILTSAGNIDWLILGLEFGPRDDVLTWASQVVNSFPDRRVIVVTHSHIYSDNSLHGSNPGHQWTPNFYGFSGETGGANNGQQVWDKFLKKHKNISIPRTCLKPTDTSMS